MAIRLEEDQRTLASAEALLAGLAKFGITYAQVSEVKVPPEVEKLFNEFTRTAYRNRELAEGIEGFSFWGLLDWALSCGYDNWIAKPDRESASEFLKIISRNLQRETKPKLVIAPVRKTIMEAPVQVGPCFIVPHQETEEEFVATLKSIGFSPAKMGRAFSARWRSTMRRGVDQRSVIRMSIS
jgi:hypothetical protein